MRQLYHLLNKHFMPHSCNKPALSKTVSCPVGGAIGEPGGNMELLQLGYWL